MDQPINPQPNTPLDPQNTAQTVNWEALYPDPQIRAVVRSRFESLQAEKTFLQAEKTKAQKEIDLLNGSEKTAENKIQKINAEIKSIISQQTTLAPPEPVVPKPVVPPAPTTAVATPPPTPPPAPKPAAPAPAPAPQPIPPQPTPEPAAETSVSSTPIATSVEAQLQAAEKEEQTLRQSNTATAADIAMIQKKIKDLESQKKPTPTTAVATPPPTPPPAPKPAAPAPAPAPQPIPPQPTPEPAAGAPQPTPTTPPPAPQPIPPQPADPNNKTSSIETRIYRTESDIIDALGLLDKGKSIYDMGRDEYHKLHVVKAGDGGIFFVFGNVDDPGNPYTAHFSSEDLMPYPSLMEAINTILSSQTPKTFNG